MTSREQLNNKEVSAKTKLDNKDNLPRAGSSTKSYILYGGVILLITLIIHKLFRKHNV